MNDEEKLAKFPRSFGKNSKTLTEKISGVITIYVAKFVKIALPLFVKYMDCSCSFRYKFCKKKEISGLILFKVNVDKIGF